MDKERGSKKGEGGEEDWENGVVNSIFLPV